MFYLNTKCLSSKNAMTVYLGKIAHINVCKKNNVTTKTAHVPVDVTMDIEALNVKKKSEYTKTVQCK